MPATAAPIESARRLECALVDLLVIAGAAMVLVPLVLTFYLSVFDEPLIIFPPRGYTLHWYAAVLPNFGAAMATSVQLALVAVAGSLALGVPAGIGLARYRFRGRGAIATLLIAPLTLPGIALGLAIYVFLVLVETQTGWPVTGSLTGLVCGHLLITTPWVVRLCLASLANHDRTLEEAAASLGAGPARVVWRITLPAMRGGILAGGLFAFIVSFENLEMALFLTSPGMTTLPVATLGYLEYHIDPLVAAVAVVQMVAVGAVLLVLDRFVRIAEVVR